MFDKKMYCIEWRWVDEDVSNFSDIFLLDDIEKIQAEDALTACDAAGEIESWRVYEVHNLAGLDGLLVNLPDLDEKDSPEVPEGIK
jgi:hypothetical protein